MATEEISFAQFFFWNGIGAVGLGGYIWYDANKKWKRGAGIVLTLGGIVCSFLAVSKVNAFLLGLNLPVFLGPTLLIVSWGIIGYDIYLKKRSKKSKLAIHWANYRATEGEGDVYEVSEFLRQIISGDSLVFDIENHNFVIGDKNFVPKDPLFGKVKRLQVNYSYGGSAPVTTERREHDRLLLPEDSKIKWLTSEVERLKTSPDISFVFVNLISLRVDGKTVSRGSKLKITYRVNASKGVSGGVWLGASMGDGKGNGFSNPREDESITLLKGEHEYSRELTVPTDRTPGNYKLWANVWYGVLANGDKSVVIASGNAIDVAVTI